MKRNEISKHKLLSKLSQGETDFVIDLLFESFEKLTVGRNRKKEIEKEYSKLILLSGRNKDLHSQYQTGVLSPEVFLEKKNLINLSVVQYINSLPYFFFNKNKKVTVVEGKKDKKTKLYDVFICASNEDYDTGRSIYNKLIREGYSPFFADESLDEFIGLSYFSAIEEAISEVDSFVLICSPRSMESEWVKAEYETYYNESFVKSKAKKKFYIYTINGATVNNVPFLLRRIQIVKTEDKLLEFFVKEANKNSTDQGEKKLEDSIEFKRESLKNKRFLTKLNIYKRQIIIGICLLAIASMLYTIVYPKLVKQPKSSFALLLEKSRIGLGEDIFTTFIQIDSLYALASNESEIRQIDVYVDSIKTLIFKDSLHADLGYFFLGNSRSKDNYLYEPDIVNHEREIVKDVTSFELYKIYECLSGNRTLRKEEPNDLNELSEIEILRDIKENEKFIIVDSVSSYYGETLDDIKYWAKVIVEKDSIIDLSEILIDVRDSNVNEKELEDRIIYETDKKFYVVVLTYSKSSYAIQQLDNLIANGFESSKILATSKDKGTFDSVASEEEVKRDSSSLDTSENVVLQLDSIQLKRLGTEYEQNKDYLYQLAITKGFPTFFEAQKALDDLKSKYNFKKNKLFIFEFE